MKEVQQQLRKEERNVSIELQRLNFHYEEELKNRFNGLNQRLRAIEEVIREMQRGKFKFLEEMKQELSMQIANARDEFLGDNISLKQRIDNYFSKEKSHQASSCQNTPESKTFID